MRNMNLYDQVQESKAYIQAQYNFQPKVGIILGTGLGNLTDEIEVVASIPYVDIPHFPLSTVESHKSTLILGHLNGVAVVALAGRFHHYEGYKPQKLTFPTRVLNALGIELLIISNVSGSVNTAMLGGDIVFVKDHIFFQNEHPLRGENDERLGSRFPDMSNTYNRTLNKKALKIAKANNIRAHEGIYFCLSGPSLETPAEYEFINRVGADLVGMSTIPEVIVAKHSGLDVFVLSVVSNLSYPKEEIKETTIEEVIALARAAEPKMSLIVKKLISH